MSRDRSREVELQRTYYAETASAYDAQHGDEPEHGFALALMIGMLDYVGATSVLDVGAGTGRAMRAVRLARPDLRVRGLEPVAALRTTAIAHGIPADDIGEGDAQRLPYADGAFDLVCAFGVLHHVPEPSRAVAEMLRVAKRGVFLSDSNNFGQGRPWVRVLKQALDAAHLWPVANLIKTRGRGYSITEGDGLSYSYSVFNDLEQLRARCRVVHVMNTVPAGRDAYRSAANVALLALKH